MFARIHGISWQAIALTFSFINSPSTHFIAQTPQPRSFLDWCQQQEMLTAAEQHTVMMLLAVAGTEDCQAAEMQLASRTDLDLSDRQIKVLTPLTSLPQLQILYLGQNQVIDLTPLASLPNLTDLYLPDNQITDVQPLGELENLETLYLDSNQIEELNALAGMRSLRILFANENAIESLDTVAMLANLEELYLAGNQIVDIRPVESLSQLIYLNLGNNRITTIESLGTLNRLVELDLSGNVITDLDALTGLPNLTTLDLRNNPLPSKTCPVFPATICLFTDNAADLYRMGEEQGAEGDHITALTTFRSALTVYQENGHLLRESDTYDRIGQQYDGLGQYANALDAYRQSAAIRAEIGDRQGESQSLAYLGITYIRLGQVERAVDSLENAWDIDQTLTPIDQSWLRSELGGGLILSGLALAYSKTGDAAKALEFAKLSLAHYRWGKDRQGEAIALNRVGEAYLNVDDLDKARLYFERARDLTREQSDHPGLARSLKGLGDRFVQLGQLSQALEKYDQAKELQQSVGDASGEGETLNAIAEILVNQGNLTEAAITLSKVVDLWESLRPGLTDADKISIADTQSHSYELLQRVLVEMNQPDKALEVSERGRARAFTELLAHRLSMRGEVAPPEQFQPPSIADIKTLVQAQNRTVVEYALVEDEVYIWVIEPTGALHFHRQSLAQFSGQKGLGSWVADSRLILGLRGRGVDLVATNPEDADPTSSSQRTPRATLRPLYQLLIQPIADLLPDDPDAPVLIIPQGELFLIPFPALLNEEGTALIDQHPLLFAPAMSLLTASRSQSRSLQIGEDAALIVGNPEMPEDPETNSPLRSLPGAEQEALDIAPLLNTDPLLREEATKAAVLSSLSEVAIAHFATHGLLDDFGTRIPGALALTPTETDSGFLTAAEIFELPLSAQLVVLSACDTGRGTITGDGVVGLSRSFLTAGVESVVVSLWSVPDAPTAVLMTEFYRQLQENPNRAIALQKAMIETRKQHPHPSAWAAFALYGQSGAVLDRRSP